MSDFIRNNNYRLSREFFMEPLDLDGICVAQVGRLFSKKNTRIEDHVHTILFEFTLVTDGEGIIYTNGTPSRVKKGDIYLSLPCDVHRIETDPEKLLKFDNVAFFIKDNPLKEEFDRIHQDFYPPKSRIFHDERIRPLISSAILELNSDEVYKKDILTSIFKQILIYALRSLRSAAPNQIKENLSQAEIVCHKLMNYIDTHVYSIKKLEELSEICDYSYGYLSSIFKKTTGNTLSNYYQERKLEASRLLILENKLSVTEIAEILNYASVYAFSKAFTKHFGSSPQKYRNKNH